MSDGAQETLAARVAELEAELARAREREQVSGEILRQISRSPEALDETLESIGEAVRATLGAVRTDWYLLEAGAFRVHRGGRVDRPSASGLADQLIDRGSTRGLDLPADSRRVVVYEDIGSDESERDSPAFVRDFVRARGTTWRDYYNSRGFGAAAHVPILREGDAIGVLQVIRPAIGPFSPAEIAMLETFADQAAIAIENARLVNELEARNRQVTEALEQQTAISDVLEAITVAGADVTPVAERIAMHAARLCNTDDRIIELVEGNNLRLIAGVGRDIELLHIERPIHRDNVSGRAILERRALEFAGTWEAYFQAYPESAARHEGESVPEGTVSLLVVPMFDRDDAVGVLGLRKRGDAAFQPRERALLETFARQAAIAIRNARLLRELQESNREVTEALEREKATREVLSVISRTPTDVQPVFDAMAESAAGLFEEYDAITILLVEGEVLRPVAHVGTARPEPGWTRAISREWAAGEAVLDGALVHVPDFLEVVDRYPEGARTPREGGYRTMIAVPLVRGGEPLGAITVRRTEFRPFIAEEITLLETFADQAVIAIENARLFREQQEALEQQTAVAEVLAAISSAPTSLDEVLETIANAAARLLDGDSAVIHRTRFEGDELLIDEAFANDPIDPEQYQAQRRVQRPFYEGSLQEVAIRTRATLQAHGTPDDVEASFPGTARFRKERGDLSARSTIATPLLTEDRAIGALTVWRRDGVRPFSDGDVRLLRTFAGQAVIAIQNARLFREQQEALERQTAMAEVLEVIAASPTDIERVLTTVAETAMHISQADGCGVWVQQGDALVMRGVAATDRDAKATERQGVPPVGTTWPIADERILPGPNMVLRAFRERETLHTANWMETIDEGLREEVRRLDLEEPHLAFATVPIVHEGRALGVISLGRTEAREFSDAHIRMTQAFANQAGIAIANARLFRELEERNREVSEALEQQTAMAEVLGIIAGSAVDTQPVLDAIAVRAARLCGADSAQVVLARGQEVETVAVSWEEDPALGLRVPLSSDFAVGKSILLNAAVEWSGTFADFQRDWPAAVAAHVPRLQARRIEIVRPWSFAVVPLISQNVALGAVMMFRMTDGTRFSSAEVALARVFADQAVIAIENARLFNELEESNREVSEALEQQTAMAEVLSVIAASATDAQPVLEAVVERVVRLTGMSGGNLRLLDGEELVTVAVAGESPARLGLRRKPNGPLLEVMTTGRPFFMQNTPEEALERWPDFVIPTTLTSYMVPLVRRGEVFGLLQLGYRGIVEVTAAQRSIAETYAAQAVIAIENARLFRELEERNDDLAATGDVLRIVSQFSTDLTDVLNAVVARAGRSVGADRGFAFIVEDGRKVGRGIWDPNGIMTAFPPSLADGAALTPTVPIDRAILERHPVHIWGTRATILEEYPGAGGGDDELTTRLCVPILRGGDAIGGMVVSRMEIRPFSDREIALVQSFADQAAIAIANSRLLNQLEERNREISEALEQQTATADVLEIISRSATDAQPVLDAIAERAARLCDAVGAQVQLIEGDESWVVSRYAPPVPDQVLRPVGLKAPMDGLLIAETVATRATVHFWGGPEEWQARFPASSSLYAHPDYCWVSVPFFHRGEVIGALQVFRLEARAFTESQVALIESFANQAVIAMENARLFNELEERNREVTEALEQQTAMGEVLEIISKSTQDEQPVLQEIAGQAAKLLDAQSARFLQLDGTKLAYTALYIAPDSGLDLAAAVPQSVQFDAHDVDGSIYAAALQARRPRRFTVRRSDTIAEPLREIANAVLKSWDGFSAMVVPLLKDGAGIGLIEVSAPGERHFTARDIRLIQTFAEQAVIAIENARLFNELEERNREISEALEQQTAMAEVLRIIAAAPGDLEATMPEIATAASWLCDAKICGVFHSDGNVLRGWDNVRGRHPDRALSLEAPASLSVVGTAVATNAPVQVSGPIDGWAERFPRDAETNRGDGRHQPSLLAVPLPGRTGPVGALLLVREEPIAYSEQHIKILQTFADQAVIALENARLFNELQESNREVSEALDQQTAMGEVLEIISSSPTDATTVLQVIVEAAARLCGATTGSIALLDPDRSVMSPVIRFTFDPVIPAAPQSLPLDRDRPVGRAIIERRTIHIFGSLDEVRDEFPALIDPDLAPGGLGFLAAPLLREGVALGGLAVRRNNDPRPFTPSQVRLLESFADQAVIAIENARLFNELEQRNREVTEALEQQTAMAEVLSIIAQSPGDATSTLDRLCEQAARLLGVENAIINLWDGDEVMPRAAHITDARQREWFSANARRLNEGGPSEYVARSGTVFVGEVRPPDPSRVFWNDAEREYYELFGRAYLMEAPLLSGTDPLGTLVVSTHSRRRYSERDQALLRTFSDQAVIAIENARLFNELEQRNREVTEALEQQTAIAEVLAVIGRSAFDLDAVLQTLVAEASRLVGANVASIGLVEGAHIVERASHPVGAPESVALFKLAIPIDTNIMQAVAIRERRALSVTLGPGDPRLDRGLPEQKAWFERFGTHSGHMVPLLSSGAPLGTLATLIAGDHRFTDREKALLQTFADQAVIAIENARLFNELQAKTEELEVVSRHKSEFLASMSHELRTPLNAIIGYAELLEEEASEGGDDEYLPDLQKIHSAGQHLLTLISGILDLSKIEAGRMTMFLEDFDIGKLVGEVEAIVTPLVEKNGNRLVVECAADVGTMHGDVVKVRQALFNLLSNAAKFTEGGTVTLRAAREGEEVTFAIADTGIGMTEEQRGRLFEAFSQANVETSRKYGGTGLGLALSREFCRMMGGDITVKSEAGVGSTFTIELPVVVREMEEAEESVPRPGGSGA